MVFSFPTFLKRILTFNTINCDVIINFDALNFQNEGIMTSQFPLLRNAFNFRSFSKFQPPFAMATAPFCTVVTLSWCQSLVMTEGTEKIYLTQLFFNVYWCFPKVAITFSRITSRIAKIKLRKFIDIWTLDVRYKIDVLHHIATTAGSVARTQKL